MGPSGMGHLVDVGCAAYHHVHLVDTLHIVSSPAGPAGRSGEKSDPVGDFWDFCFFGRAAGVSLESFVADPASTTGNRRWERFGTRSGDGQGFAAVRGRGVLRHGSGLY